MSYKVFVQTIKPDESKPTDPSDAISNSPNLNIRVKCIKTQEEFRGQAFLNTQYIEKLQRWINKNKFTCVPLNNNTEMQL